MENIFDGAKFGDRFLTRDGQPAIYHGYFHGYHCLNIADTPRHIKCFDNGKSCLTEGYTGSNWSDIVSKCDDTDSPWVSIHDRLPEEDEDILVNVKNGDDDYYGWWRGRYLLDDILKDDNQIEYWMPIPRNDKERNI